MKIVINPQIKKGDKWVTQDEHKIETFVDDGIILLDWVHSDYESLCAMPADKKMVSLIRDPFNEFYEIRLGLECNNFCTHCFISDRKKEERKTFEQIKEIIDTVPPYWLVTVTGGEASIRKDFIDIIKYIKEQKKLPYLQTNGRKFSDPTWTEEVCKYLIGTLVAIHSIYPEVHDAITQVKGSFEETKQGIINLVADGRPLFSSQTVIVKKNYNHLLEIADMIQDIAPGTRMCFTFPHPVAGAFDVNVTPSLREVRPYVLKLLAKWGNLIQTHYIPKCYLRPYENDVFDGDIYETGVSIRPGIDVLDGNLVEVNYGSLKKGAKLKKPECINCKYDDICMGVWREYTQLYEFEVYPIEE